MTHDALIQGKPIPKRVAVEGPSACVVCATPFTGTWGWMFYLSGIRRSARNPGVCSRCNQHIEDGALSEITVVFADLSGFTKLTNEVGAERAHEIVEAFLKMSFTALIAHDGAIDKFIGDAVMAFFNVPIAREDHARCALEAADDIQRGMAGLSARFNRPLTSQIGVATGWAKVGRLAGGEVTAIGAPVNLAARLEAHTRPGEILADAAASKSFDLEGRRPSEETLALKGFLDPVAVRRWPPLSGQASAKRRVAAVEDSPGLSLGAAVFAVLGAPCAAAALLGPLVVPLGLGSFFAASSAIWVLDSTFVRFMVAVPAVLATAANLYALSRAKALRRGLAPTPLERARRAWVHASAFLVVAAFIGEALAHYAMKAMMMKMPMP